MRAMSRRTRPRRAVSSSCPVTCWNRRLNSSCFVSTSRVSSSMSASFRRSLVLRHQTSTSSCGRAHDELGLDGQLLDGALHGGLGQLLGNAGELEHDAAALDHGNPMLGVALA